MGETAQLRASFGAQQGVTGKIFTLVVMALLSVGSLATAPAGAAVVTDVVWLDADDFTYGTYIIDQPGTYMLAEDISFNPNSPRTLDAAIRRGDLPQALAEAMGIPTPVDAYAAGFPLFTQFAPGGVESFAPGGPLDGRYDPAAFGVGFFAAIAISADDVVLDLNGHTIEQSAEHALLQRFFAVIELADQPFVPSQGPFDFGEGIDAATNTTIRNGTIGRSSHHGIHGNANVNITVSDIRFRDYEVAAVALNGVDGLLVEDVTAVNRKDVPVVGTFSSAQFIKQFVDELARTGSQTTLTVDGATLGVTDIQSGLRTAINDTHADLVAAPNIVDGRPQIDAVAHPDEFALFHNQHGVVDGNAYSFLLNGLGVAVNGFPLRPDGVTSVPSTNVQFNHVHVRDQRAFINEVPAVNVGGVAAIDPVGAVFQIRNLNPATGQPITISHSDDSLAKYVGNAVANAQAFVAKAEAEGEFDSSHLNLSRMNIPDEVLSWVESEPGHETLAAAGVTYVCNGDSMFHVNKGVIGFKMDAVAGLDMDNTSVTGLVNLGEAGSDLCGNYLEGHSHPLATLLGYGGAVARGYTFAGTSDATITNSAARDVEAVAGSAFGFDILTDSSNIQLIDTEVRSANAGSGGVMPDGSPTKDPKSYAYYVASDASDVSIIRACATNLSGLFGSVDMDDASGSASIVDTCVRRN